MKYFIFSFLMVFSTFGFANDADRKLDFYRSISDKIEDGYKSTNEGLESDLKDFKKLGCATDPKIQKDPAKEMSTCSELRSEIRTLKMDQKSYQEQKDCIRHELAEFPGSTEQLVAKANKVTPPTFSCETYLKEWEKQYLLAMQNEKFVSESGTSKVGESSGQQYNATTIQNGASQIIDTAPLPK